MPLPNPQRFDNVAQAVQFAAALRQNDGTNYNVERIGGRGFDRDQLLSLLRQNGYKEYKGFRLDVRIQRSAAHAEAWVTSSRPHPKTVEILQDFSARPFEQPKPHLQQAHQQFNAPIAAFVQSRLLTLLLQPEHAHVYCTAFSGPMPGVGNVGQEEVLFRLVHYVQEYLAPLRFGRSPGTTGTTTPPGRGER
jgi:hypothetical protein